MQVSNLPLDYGTKVEASISVEISNSAKLERRFAVSKNTNI
jgi:hypothetical protein